jgi:hypothetical protein
MKVIVIVDQEPPAAKRRSRTRLNVQVVVSLMPVDTDGHA